MNKSRFSPASVFGGLPRPLDALKASLLSLVLLGAIGCQSPPESTESDPANATVGEYFDQDLQGEVRGVVGVPLYSVSPELGANGLEGRAGFLLLSPRDPQRALVVLVPEATPEELVERPSGLLSIDGVVEGELPQAAADYLQENYPVDLAKTGERPLLLKAEKLEAAELEEPTNGEPIE